MSSGSPDVPHQQPFHIQQPNHATLDRKSIKNVIYFYKEINIILFFLLKKQFKQLQKGLCAPNFKKIGQKSN